MKKEKQLSLGAKENAERGKRNGEPAQAPSIVEYEVEGAAWRCNQFALLMAEVGELTPTTLHLFHAQAALRERGWLIVRRLFGLQPMIPASDYATDDLRVWSREELRAALGLTAKQLQAELDAVRGAWRAIAPKPAMAMPDPEPESLRSRHELPFDDSEILKRHDVRIKFRDLDERAVFVKRVADYERLLTEPRVAGLARNTLMTEFQLRRLDEQLANCIEGTSDWRKNMELRKDLDRTYQGQLEQINKLAPWAGMIAGKFAFAGVISDVTRAFQEYCGQGDTALADGIFTATEIRVECRRSVQAPEPRYRAGLVVFLNEAKAGLLDPHFQSQLSPGQLARITEAWRASYVTAEQEAGVPLPDLEKDGEEGEYQVVGETPNTKHQTPNTNGETTKT